MRSRWVPAAAVVLVGALSGGCGVGTEDEPRALAGDDVPFRLLQLPTTTLAPPTTTTVAGAARRTAVVSIFFVQQGRLVATIREVPAPARLADVLELLVAGPTEEEARNGLLSAISPATELLDVTIEDGVARVNLSSAFIESQVRDQTEAVAQIVFTAAGLPGVSGITLALAGRAVEVPAADGTLRRDTLTPADYATLTSEQERG